MLWIYDRKFWLLLLLLLVRLPLLSLSLFTTITPSTATPTGGDAEGHPGVHAYLEDDLILNVVVCNGTHFWRCTLIGVFYEESWTNLGARWRTDFGLEVSQVQWVRSGGV